MLPNNRIVFLDWLRFIACFMVILVHCIEPFYLGGPEGTYIASMSDAFWVTAINSALRPCVPLFVLASSYLLFPVKSDTGTFFRKRFTRVVIPFVIWSLLYIFIPPFVPGAKTDIASDLKAIPFNFVMTASGHLWFVYMLLGVYLVMPMLSPWIEKISRKGERNFLILWAFTTILPLFRPLAETVTGTTALWGECPWNPFGTFYYVSGFVGFLVLGHYIRTYAGEVSWKKTLAYAAYLIPWTPSAPLSRLPYIFRRPSSVASRVHLPALSRHMSKLTDPLMSASTSITVTSAGRET